MALPISAEGHRQAIKACALSLAGRLSVNEGVPDLPPAAFPVVRGAADAWACHRRFRMPESAAALRPEGVAGAWFDRLTEARAEVLGGDWLPGLASNLAYRQASEMAGSGLSSLTFYLGLSGQLPKDAVDCALGEALDALRDQLLVPLSFANLARSLSMALAATPTEAVDVLCDASSAMPSSLKEGEAEQPPQTMPWNGDSTTQTSSVSMTGEAVPALPAEVSGDYRIFSTQYDRLLCPEDIAAPEALQQWRSILDRRVRPYQHWVARLAHRLQRRLLARQRRDWAFDQETGYIDGRRLARLVSRADQAALFKCERDSPFRETAVTLLLDNSGSMRGQPIALTAMTTDILARTFERCHIKVEILGYTTAPSQNNPVTEAWKAVGRPAGAGRLNCLRLMIYKAMDTPWRQARRGLGLMLDDTLLQENVDGEALALAAQRLLRRSESRKVLIVISDGVPMEPDTLTANPRDYLEQHLNEVVTWIRTKTLIEMHAIGIGHDVSRFYPSAALVREVEQLGPVLIDKLSRWLD
jgi:cobalamin biosynthesis protein CobT